MPPAAPKQVRALMLAFVLALSLAGCGGCGSKPKPSPTPPPQPPAANGAMVTANIVAVDLDGHPLAGMVPIASTRPNAFEAPVAHGEPTKADGSGSVSIPAAEHLYLRAWDPELKRFANNFYDILPGTEMDPAPLKVMMVSGARLTAQLLNPDGKPAAKASVDLKMSHPTQGPWWPARAEANDAGIVEFQCVPAGRYNVRIETAETKKADLAGVELPPGGAKDLGQVSLQ